MALLREIDLSESELRSILSAPNFFGKLHPYLSTLFSGNPVGALNEGLAFLSEIRKLNDAAYASQHKGTPFYWLGISAFLAHDFQTAVFFFNAAVSEDLRNGANPSNADTPALKFIYIEGDTPGHAAQPLVEEMQSKISHELECYNQRPGRIASLSDLALPHIRTHFIGRLLKSSDRHLRTLATTFLSYILEWKHRNALAQVGIDVGSADPFFFHLFKGCVLFESLLKANPKKTPTGDTLGKALRELSSDLGIPNTIDIRSPDFASILSTIAPNESLTTAIERTGKIRNTLGHNLGWPASLDSTKYNLLAQDVAASGSASRHYPASCFHAINSLYR